MPATHKTLRTKRPGRRCKGKAEPKPRPADLRKEMGMKPIFGICSGCRQKNLVIETPSGQEGLHLSAGYFCIDCYRRLQKDLRGILYQLESLSFLAEKHKTNEMVFCVHCQAAFAAQDITAHILVCDQNPVVVENQKLKARLLELEGLASNG